MRSPGLLLLISPLLLGQDAGGQKAAAPASPKNLKVLMPEVNILQVMRGFTAGLGVQCSYCHVAGDFASDASPKKETARRMLRMIKEINAHFPDSGNDFANSRYLPFPEGKQYITCYTCHQGEIKPKFETPEPVKRAPEPHAPAPQGDGVPGIPPGPALTPARGAPSGPAPSN